MNLEVRTQTHKPDQTKINIYRFDMAKSAAQLLYGPVLVNNPTKLSMYKQTDKQIGL